MEEMGNIAGTELLEKVRSMGVQITLSRNKHNLVVTGISERLSVDLRIVLSQRKAERLEILRSSAEQKTFKKTVYVWEHRGWILKPVGSKSDQREVVLLHPKTLVDMYRRGSTRG